MTLRTLALAAALALGGPAWAQTPATAPATGPAAAHAGSFADNPIVYFVITDRFLDGNPANDHS